MSWNLFKQNIINKLCNAKQVPDINYVAKTFAEEYDAVVKRGGTIPDNIKVLSGNKQLMETLFLTALQKGLNSTEPYDLVGEMGKGVKAYWSTAQLSTFPIPFTTPVQISTGVIVNTLSISNSITNPGIWNSANDSNLSKKTDTNNESNNQNKNNNESNKKILLVGDSITVDAGYTWSSYYKKYNDKSDVEILAIGGKQLTLWMKPELDKKLATTKYEKVYIYGGTNDIFSAKKAETVLASLQTMVDSVNKTGAKAIVVTGYDSETDMLIQNMPLTRYVTTKDGYIPYLQEYQKYQKLISQTITNATIVPKISVGVIKDGFHPVGNQSKILFEQINKY
ncbi:MAG: SGNH/GDSL hydrolase family protein [Candidatus Fonsibacter ubiquis]